MVVQLDFWADHDQIEKLVSHIARLQADIQTLREENLRLAMRPLGKKARIALTRPTRTESLQLWSSRSSMFCKPR